MHNVGQVNTSTRSTKIVFLHNYKDGFRFNTQTKISVLLVVKGIQVRITFRMAALPFLLLRIIAPSNLDMYHNGQSAQRVLVRKQQRDVDCSL
jgi:hypothetical protein